MRRRLFGLVATLALVAGCGLDAGYKLPFEVGPGSIRPVPELQGVTIKVASKNFTEQILLGYIAEVALAAAGADVEDLTNIQGSPSVRQALEVGDVDLYWEYTGTSWINFQQETVPIPDEQAQYDAVKKADEERFGIAWLDYSPVNDKYAIATTREFADQHKLRTMSDMVALLQQDPSLGTFCLESEFISRQDGLAGAQKKYGFDLPGSGLKTFGVGAIYATLAGGRTCNFGEVFTTDGRILTLDLAVLEDDKKTFPQYNAAVTVRTEFLDQYPELADVLNPVAAKLDNDTILDLSVKIDGDGDDPAVVARDWLVKEGFVTRK
ncbi:glycine betaine ABC transporter substrate-binding protein [Actinophytocola oryzae]|uniref:Osmoprotectant transport system substrate-binding protein n=1 Tax=Actinophytocola oryzae TaxID=502181 RepID=A0A4R7UY58_9PSEU|nr:glycine betaine ABC transporter substrate-binding protein [Actinophytocola oryzae]TDV41012.1 osmoprotectant transport system substrate-binding protein [Actinophytocola oryzae]